MTSRGLLETVCNLVRHFPHSYYGSLRVFFMLARLKWNLIIFNGGEVTDFLVWSYSNFAYLKMSAEKTWPLCKNYTSTKLPEQSIRFCKKDCNHCKCSVSTATFNTSLQSLWKLICCYSNFSLSIQRHSSTFKTVSQFVLVTIRKLPSKSLLRKFTPFMTSSAVNQSINQ